MLLLFLLLSPIQSMDWSIVFDHGAEQLNSTIYGVEHFVSLHRVEQTFRSAVKANHIAASAAEVWEIHPALHKN